MPISKLHSCACFAEPFRVLLFCAQAHCERARKLRRRNRSHDLVRLIAVLVSLLALSHSDATALPLRSLICGWLLTCCVSHGAPLVLFVGMFAMVPPHRWSFSVRTRCLFFICVENNTGTWSARASSRSRSSTRTTPLGRCVRLVFALPRCSAVPGNASQLWGPFSSALNTFAF